MATIVSINIIDNRNKRLEIIKPLLDFLVKNNAAKNDNGLYIVSSRLISKPMTEPEKLFKALQEQANREGHQFNCYNFKTDD